MTFLVSPVAIAAESPLEVKGFPLGGSRAALVDRFKLLTCVGDFCGYSLTTCDIEKTRSCGTLHSDLMIGDIPVNWEAHIDNDRVVTIALITGEANFNLLVAALRQKYGKPTTDAVARVQNPFGASFEDRVVVWKRHDGEVQAVRRFGKLTLSAVVFNTLDAQQSARKAADKKTKKAAAGL